MDQLQKKGRFWVPEIIASSKISSGLAVMRALLEGYNLPLTRPILYAAAPFRTKEPTLSEIKQTVTTAGFQLTHCQLPPDEFMWQLKMPAISAKKTKPDEAEKWQLLWLESGPLIQMMDPEKGRIWQRKQAAESSFQISKTETTPEKYLLWTQTAYFQDNLIERIRRLGIAENEINTLLTSLDQTNWQKMGTVDASVRFLLTLINQKKLTRSSKRYDDLQNLLNVNHFEHSFSSPIPEQFWTIIPYQPTNQPTIYYHRKVELLLIDSPPLHTEEEADNRKTDTPKNKLKDIFYTQWQNITSAPAEQLLWHYYSQDGFYTTIALILAIFVVSAGFTIETFLLQGILNINQSLTNPNQKIIVQLSIICFFAALLLVNFQTETIGQTVGRRMEAQIRILFLKKIPHLGHQFFQNSRISDLTQRAYALRTLHNIPDLGLKFLQTTFQLIFTITGIIWLEYRNAPLVLLSTIFTIFWFYYTQPILARKTTTLSLDSQSLNRIYLDTLLGLTTVRVHSAAQFIRQKHEQLMADWAKSSLDFFDFSTLIQTVSPIVNTSITILIIFNYSYHDGEAQNMLLLAFWAVNIPKLSLQIASSFQDYLQKRTVLNMLLEPIYADDELIYTMDQPVTELEQKGLELTLTDVSLVIDNLTLFHPTTLTIKPNEHIAIVGSSGAGKSTLANLLLGWYQISTGSLLLDGIPLNRENIYQLYRQTAWVDPSIQIWNHSLLDNLQYASGKESDQPLIKVIEQADLLSVLNILPDGMKTKLGEEGRLLSGGQAQRVRLGRAMMQTNIRLVILDEPFRGLDRDKRKELLKKARLFWSNATLICITHDVIETNHFPRVLVVEKGRITEDDDPAQLLSNPHSRYTALIQAEEDVRHNLWQGAEWKRIWLENGSLTFRENINDK